VGNGFPTRPSGKDPGVYKNYMEVIIMVVQHNMQAANANRMLNLTVNGQQKSTEKLSSGYRINRAADDAAGLAISEKMRSQIRGLDRASTNAQDGISVVQTAEGALNEVHSMLQRMNELATQAANDTNTSSDRSQIQLEVDQLTSEIDRVASTTQFNTMNLLDGSFTGKQLQVGSLSGQTIQLDIKAMDADALGLKTVQKAGSVAQPESHNTIELGNNSTTAKVDAATGDFSTADTGLAVGTYEFDVQNQEWHNSQGQKVDVDITKLQKTGVNLSVPGKDDTATDNPKFTIKTGGLIDGTPTGFKKNGITINVAQPKSATNAILDDASVTKLQSAAEGTYKADASGDFVNTETGEKLTNINFAYDTSSTAKAAEGTTITLKGHKAATTATDPTNVKALDVTTHDGAESSMKRVQDAIDTVSTQRATLGAVQNRLEHTIANLDTTSENTQAAESRIRDTDMAKEMVTWSKNNILAQAGQSMLAQANQSNQGVLSLLQ
jgi:flagellin